MLAHRIRGGCWWSGSWHWTFPSVFHYMLLCDRQGSKGAAWQCLRWKYRWSRSVSLNSSMWKKWHALALVSACWAFMGTKQWMWAQGGGGWCVSAVAAAIWKMSYVPDSHVQLSHHKKSWSAHPSRSANGGHCAEKQCSWEFSPSNAVAVLLISVVVSMEINRRHYFQINLPT